MTNDGRGARMRILIAVALLAATFVAYWQVLGSDFINFDDDVYVTANPQVRSGLNRSSIAWAFTAYHAANWHPLTWMSHMLDCRLYGLRPTGHHLTNLVFHAANAILLFLVLTRMTRHPWRSAFVAALFALHPLHVESVAWVAERKDVLSTFFWMLAMLAYARYAAKPSVARYLLVPLLMALGLMAKPMLMTLPLVLLMVDYWPLGRLRLRGSADGGSGRNAPMLILEKTPLVALSAISGIITIKAQSAGGAVAGTDVVGIGERVANAMMTYISYLAKMMWPAGLSVYYPRPLDAPNAWHVAGVVAALAFISVLAVRFGVRRRYLLTGWLWYVVTLVPVIGLLQVGYQSRADRYTYIPLIGIFIIFSWGLSELVAEKAPSGGTEGKRAESKSRKKKREFPLRGTLAAPAGIVLAVMLVLTWRQVGYWRNSGTLFEHAIAVTPENYIAHNNLGTFLMGENRAGEALPHFREAVRLRPDFAPAHFNVALITVNRGEKAEAIDALTKGLQLKPNDVGARYLFGTLLHETGRVDEAMVQYREVIRLRPNFVEAEVNLGVLLGGLGRFDEAVEHFKRAIQIDGRFAKGHNNLASILYHMGRYAEAWDAIHAARRAGIDPNPALVNDLAARMKEPPQ